jgi:acyl-coenzyme A synthetase/AMP-(fatty) acid ligase
MSYAELQTKITKLGSALTRQGFGKGDVMTIISPNCPEFCLICLAAAAIGMTVSAVNPQYTQGKYMSSCFFVEICFRFGEDTDKRHK